MFQTIAIAGVFQYLISLSIPINPNIPLTLLAVSGLFIGLDRRHCYSSYKKPLVFTVLAFLVSIMVSALFSNSSERIFALTTSFFPALLLAFLIVELFTINFGYLMFCCFSILSLIVATSALLAAHMGKGQEPSSWIRDISNLFLVVPNDLILITLLMPFSAVLAFKKRSSPTGLLAILSILMTLSAVITFQSRSGLISAMISIGCFSLLLTKRRFIEIFSITVIFLLLVDWIQGFKIINKFENFWQSRLFIWITGWKMFTDSFLIGHGPRTFGTLYFPYRDSLNLPDWILVDHRWMPWAHNLYLETLVEQGIIGLLCFFFLIVFGILSLSRLLRSKSEDIRIISIGVFASFVSMIIAGFSELSFIRHWFVILFFSILALVHALLLLNDESERQKKAGKH